MEFEILADYIKTINDKASSAATGTVQWTVPPSEDCLSDWGTEQGLIERDKRSPGQQKPGLPMGLLKPSC